MKQRKRILGGLAGAALIVSSTTAIAQANREESIYPEPEVAPKEIKAALAKAGREHKRVILDFGGDWCGDCRVLDRFFHQEPNASLVKAHFVLVHVNIGQFDRNQEIAKQYGVPLAKGVPALAVLDAKGHPVFSQKQGEFESMRKMDPASVTQFLKRWKR
ncbi:thioredoxin family protein [Fimbriimonas ginsengisoli]|uniref:Thioredoxin family protein n=1 Tax=Fimbriimonas ginsengisoli Gsoil 348 TaxID=661478 RepID=A0A068NQL6_FIMGI|nr:thioredoxin family protein [Fimbriimonas ginsengisoli]AIE85853.1 thioredoxin family protein [Fimbriimonas ginsengisoli Gsoil 348]